MKKILIITSGILPVPANKGGAVESLIDILVEQNEIKKDFEFTIYSCETDKREIKKNTEYRYILTQCIKFKIKKIYCAIINKLTENKHGNAFVMEIIKNLKKRNEIEKYDFVLVENVPNYVLPLKKVFDKKIILHVHNDWLNVNTKNSKIIKESCKSIYAVSEFVKNRVEEIDESDKNVKLLYNGIDIERFKEKNENEDKIIREKYNIKNDELIFMFVGKLSKAKGADILIETYNRFSITNKNSKLLLVGSSFNKNSKDSDETLKIKEKAKENKNVIFTGFIDYNEIQKIYNLSKVQCVISQIEDSCPLVVLEGLASGNALIVSDSGGIPELVDKSNAIIIKRNQDFSYELYNAFEKLYNNKDLVNTMGKNSINKSNNYSIQRFYSKFVELISKER